MVLYWAILLAEHTDKGACLLPRLLLIEYAFSVLFTDAALDYIYENTMDEGAELLDKYYGSVYKSTETLFRALLGVIFGAIFCRFYKLYRPKIQMERHSKLPSSGMTLIPTALCELYFPI